MAVEECGGTLAISATEAGGAVSVKSPEDVDSWGIRLPLEGKLTGLVASDGRCDEKSGALGNVGALG